MLLLLSERLDNNDIRLSIIDDAFYACLDDASRTRKVSVYAVPCRFLRERRRRWLARRERYGTQSREDLRPA